MNKLIALGCSLTYDIGVKEKLAELLGYQLVPLAQTAGSNGLQINKFHEFVLQNETNTNDIVYWQITSPTRNAVRLYPSKETFSEVKHIQDTEFAPKDRYHYIQNSFNAFDNISRLDMLCNSPWSLVDFDSNEQLQNIMSNIILCSKVYPKTIVVFGWNDMINQHEKDVFKYYFEKHNVKYIKDYYLEWVISQNLQMWDNDKHPDTYAGQQFAEHVIYNKIKELNWI